MVGTIEPPAPRWTGPATPPPPELGTVSKVEMAAPWVAIGVALVALVSMALWVRAELRQNDTLPVVPVTDAYGLEVGACYLVDTIHGTTTGASCAGTHDIEVFHAFLIVEETFQEDETIRATAIEGCLSAFEDYTGTPYDRSALTFNALWPDGSEWRAGARDVVCWLHLPGMEPLLGPARGSGL